ncbi:unnamed protein product [Blepharisma stoltei]|uniref:Uncharacterized protein n=1 Tax=Blepharisma stoltei TaxID=1481888 RepID=A0AAU9I8G5_9CILI|nr:unnamed protein product [Blepharisma stoltei]
MASNENLLYDSLMLNHYNSSSKLSGKLNFTWNQDLVLLQRTDISNFAAESLKTIDSSLANLGFEPIEKKTEKEKTKSPSTESDLSVKLKALSSTYRSNNSQTLSSSKKMKVTDRNFLSDEIRQNKKIEEIQNFIAEREQTRRVHLQRAGSISSQGMRKELRTAHSLRRMDPTTRNNVTTERPNSSSTVAFGARSQMAKYSNTNILKKINGGKKYQKSLL